MKLFRILSACALAALVACNPVFEYEAAPADTLELEKTTVKFLSDASTESIEVESSSSVKVAVDTAAKWLSAEIASGEVVVSAEANPDIFDRSGVITVSTSGRSVDIKVIQAGMDLNFALDNEAIVSGWESSSTALGVTSNVSWQLVPNVDWITPSAYEGAGSASVTLVAASNPSLSSREGYVYFYHGEELLGRVSVNQAQLVPEVVYSPSETISEESSAFTKTLTVNANWPWTVYTSAADSLWIQLTSPAVGSDGLIPAGSNLSVSVSGTQTKAGRTGTIYFKTEDTVYSLAVEQAGMATTLSVTKTAMDFATPAAASNTFSLTTNNNWEIKDLPSWITVDKSSGEEGTHEVTVSVTKREGANHSGTFKVVSGDKEETITVTQAAGAIHVEIPIIPWHLGEYGNIGDEKYSLPFTEKLTSGTAVSYNLGVLHKTLKSNPEITIDLFSNHGYVDGNTSNGIRMNTYLSGTPNDTSMSNAIRNEDFAYIKLPALEGLTLKKVVVWLNAGGGSKYIMWVTSDPFVSNADAASAEKAKSDPTKYVTAAKTEFVMELTNTQANTPYYIFFTATGITYQFRYIGFYYE